MLLCRHVLPLAPRPMIGRVIVNGGGRKGGAITILQDALYIVTMDFHHFAFVVGYTVVVSRLQPSHLNHAANTT
jgi:hypothetical protein